MMLTPVKGGHFLFGNMPGVLQEKFRFNLTLIAIAVCQLVLRLFTSRANKKGVQVLRTCRTWTPFLGFVFLRIIRPDS